MLITSVRTSKKAGAPRHTLSGSAAEASRRALAVKRTCSTSAATAAAALNHPHATLFDALKDHTALRAEWLAELEAARVLTEVERERANEAARATEAIRIELAMRRLVGPDAAQRRCRHWALGCPTHARRPPRRRPPPPGVLRPAHAVSRRPPAR